MHACYDSTTAANTGTISATATAGIEDAAAVMAELQNDLQEARLAVADSAKLELAATRAAATLRADIYADRVLHSVQLCFMSTCNCCQWHTISVIA